MTARGGDGSGEGELTLSEKRAAAAHARWSVEAHPLFLYEPGERPAAIGWINLRRYTNSGPVDCPRVFPAAELTSEQDIFSMFGGGTFELLGRSSLPNGAAGAIVKKRRLSLDGRPRPFAGGPDEYSQAPEAQSGGGMDPMMSIFLAQMQEDRRAAAAREERRDIEARAEAERRQQREDSARQQSTALIVQGLQVAATLVSSMLNRPAPPPAPPGPDLMPLLAQLIPRPQTTDPIDQATKLLAFAKEAAPAAAPEKTESLGDLLAGFGQAAQGIGMLEAQRIEAAKNGVLNPPMPPPPEQAAAAANGNGHDPAPPPPQLEHGSGAEAARLAS